MSDRFKRTLPADAPLDAVAPEPGPPPSAVAAGEVSIAVAALDRTLDRLLAQLGEGSSAYHSLGDVVDYGLWVCDARGYNRYVSPSFAALLGTSATALDDLGWARFLHPDDAAETQRLWLACVADGHDLWNREHRFLGHDGAYHDVLARGKPVRDAGGRILLWVGLNLDISDYKATERKLIESNRLAGSLNRTLQREVAKNREESARLDLALRASGMIGVYDGDLKARTVRVDENYARLTGIDPALAQEAMPSGYYTRFIHPDDLASSHRAVEVMMEGKRDYIHEHRVIRPDGSVMWVFSRGRLLRDADGTPARFVGVVVDITERKQIESRERFLLGLEERLRHAADPRAVMRAAAAHLGTHLGADRVGYAEIHPDGESFAVAQDWCSPGTPSLRGFYALADFGAAPIAALRRGDVIRIEDTQQEPAIDPAAAATFAKAAIGAAITVPLIRQNRFVMAFYVHQQTPRRWSADDEALCRDVATRTWGAVERAQAEEAAQTSAAQFQKFAEAMANHVWTATPDGLLDWVNRRTTDYTGLPEAALCGTGWAQTIHPDDLPEVAARWDRSIADGRDYETQFRLRRADGAYRWHLVRAVAIRAGDPEAGADRIMRWIGTNTDIEEQKITAQALADLNENLQEEVRLRTGELLAAEESLRQSQKMEAVGQLTGGLAHDFNNLLTGIAGSLEMLESRLAQGRIKELDRYIHVAQSAAKRAAALTHRLLAFSRRQTLDPRPTDINRLIADLDELVRRTVGPMVAVEVVQAAGLWMTLVDPNQLENAILNLCINARDAMPDGGRITIETGNRWLDQQAARERDLAPGQYLSVCVSDTGTGMTADVIERAFDPFFTTKPLGEGTGLGLSMVYGFVRQSGGQARIYSELGQGTNVCLYLPRYLGEDKSAEIAMEWTDAHRAHDGETVMVVDDEPSVRMLVTEVLEDLGYRALEAEDAQTALRMLDGSGKIDLLITDVGLPGGMNGRQLADAALVHRPGLKVLFITGYAENAVVGDGLLKQGMHLVTKPFALEALATRIKEIVQGDKKDFFL